MEHFWWALAGGAGIICLTVWLFIFQGRREKKIAFMQMEEAALEIGDESLSMLLQQCQNEEEREIVYNFAKEQMAKEARLEKTKKSPPGSIELPGETGEKQETALNHEIASMGVDDQGQTASGGGGEEKERGKLMAGDLMENEEEYTRIVDKNSLI